MSEPAEVLNAIREGQVDQGRMIAQLDSRLGNVENEVHSGFAEMCSEMRSGFAEMRRVHTVLAHGQASITDLLTRHINEHESGNEG